MLVSKVTISENDLRVQDYDVIIRDTCTYLLVYARGRGKCIEE